MQHSKDSFFLLSRKQNRAGRLSVTIFFYYYFVYVTIAKPDLNMFRNFVMLLSEMQSLIFYPKLGFCHSGADLEMTKRCPTTLRRLSPSLNTPCPYIYTRILSLHGIFTGFSPNRKKKMKLFKVRNLPGKFDTLMKFSSKATLNNQKYCLVKVYWSDWFVSWTSLENHSRQQFRHSASVECLFKWSAHNFAMKTNELRDLTWQE